MLETDSRGLSLFAFLFSIISPVVVSAFGVWLCPQTRVPKVPDISILRSITNPPGPGRRWPLSGSAPLAVREPPLKRSRELSDVQGGRGACAQEGETRLGSGLSSGDLGAGGLDLDAEAARAAVGTCPRSTARGSPLGPTWVQCTLSLYGGGLARVDARAGGGGGAGALTPAIGWFRFPVPFHSAEFWCGVTAE